ncbi:MAG: cellulose synthase operon protein YhjQ/BcsQ [Pseudomonadota bacterium]
MPLVFIASSNGGVGKTTLAATLAVEFSGRGRATTLLELCGQNVVMRHLGADDRVPDGAPTGPVARPAHNLGDDAGAAMAAAARRIDDNLRVIPFSAIGERPGEFTVVQGVDFAAAVASHRLFREEIVLVDAPQCAVSELDARDDVVLPIFVLRADLSSAATLAGTDVPQRAKDQALRARFVLNMIDRRRTLCRDVEATVGEALGEALVGKIGYDEAAPESFAREPVADAAAANSRFVDETKALGDAILQELDARNAASLRDVARSA